MFKLLRRISSSIYPRPDRPWSDDATSNAPTIGRKRRLSDEDDDVQDAGSSRKRRAPLEREGTSELGELRVKGTEPDPGVKEVTRGVKEVELEDKKEESSADDDKGTAEEASATPDGETSNTLPHDPVDLPSTVPNGEADEASVVQSEAIVDAPSNDSPDVRTPEEPVAQVEDERENEEESTAAASDADNDEAARATEPVDPSPSSPKPDVTTSSPEATDRTLQEE
jgi:hypothetical protein